MAEVVLRTYRPGPGGAGAPALLLAHGAGAGQGHPWMQRVSRGLAARGVFVATFDFPYITARKRVPDAAPVLEAAFRTAWAALLEAVGPGVAAFAGGKSMGGRIASQVAARSALTPRPAGLVFFGYPLHPPGRPDQRRDAHLPAIEPPMLFVQGSKDGFGTPDEMASLTSRLRGAQLRLIEDGDHSLLAPKRRDPSGASLEAALDAAAEWITRTAGRPPG
jgi:predicted alpha/beta-hydrolase family hydrolase